MTDNHVHIGWYTDGYHSPKEVWQAEQEVGIEEIVVSSTSTCAEKYKLVVREMRELIRLGGIRIHPILWLTPRMFHSNCRWAIPYMIHSKINHCICNAGNCICSTWSTCNNGTTDFSAYTCISLCSMYRALLMSYQNVIQRIFMII